MFLLLFLVFTSCTSSTHPKRKELPKIEVELIRFEKLFYGQIDTPLAHIKSTFPYFFPSKTPDSIWHAKRTDSLQQVLFKASKAAFDPNLKDRIRHVLQRASYYFPNEKLPTKAITLLTDVDYSLRAVDADSLLLISIDTYLGSNNELYEGIPNYIKDKLTPVHLEAELIDALSYRFVPKSNSRVFLNRMITHGKRLLLHDYLAPNVPKLYHIQYTQKQWDWAVRAESEVWQYFVNNEMLFSTDDTLHFRFLAPSPYSKFYSFLDENSPGRIGQWIGYRIVQSYQKRTAASLSEILSSDPQEILKKSRYNP